MEAASADRAAEVGWEPPDWDATLRKRRRAEWRQIGFVIAVVGLLPFVEALALDRPLRVWSWFALAMGLLWAAQVWWLHFTVRGRARWEPPTRRDVRVEHALRHHVSIGAADRELVTERAESIDTWAWAHFVGWPVLAAVALLVANDDSLRGLEKWPLSLGVLAVCAWYFWDTRRRLQWALRWLDDPLPRDEQPSST